MKYIPIIYLLIFSVNAFAELKSLSDDELSESSGQYGFTVAYDGDYKADIGFQSGSGGFLNMDQKITGSPALKIDFNGNAIVITPEITGASVETAIQVGGSSAIQNNNNNAAAESAGDFSNDFINANKSNLIGISKISNISILPGSNITIRAH